MNNSFLFPYHSTPGRLIYKEDELQLEKFVGLITNKASQKSYILKVLTSFETCEKNIYSRQDLFHELNNNDSLFESLMLSLEKIKIINNAYIEKKMTFLKTKSDLTYNHEFLGGLFKEICLLTCDLIDEYFSIYTYLNNVKSKVLINLFNLIKIKVENNHFKQLRDLCLELSNEKFDLLRIRLNEQFNITSCDILKRISSQKQVSNKNAKFKVDKLIVYSKIKLTHYVLNILDNLLIFEQYITEVPFLKFSYQYYKFLHKRGLSINYPSFKTQIDYQNFLLINHLSNKDEQSNNKVLNNLKLSTNADGMLLFDNENLLRKDLLKTIALNQILAQSGLGLIAKECDTLVYTTLIIHLSSLEERNQIGGRFENECQHLAKYLNNLDNNTLLLLNEIFESTHEKQGSSSFANILNYLLSKNTKWIVATRMRLLLDEFNNNKNIEMLYI